MFPPGHFGVVLLLFAPLAYVLVVRELDANVLPGLAAALFLTLVPDLDLVVPVLVHRGVTHTFLAAGCLGAFAGVLWYGSGQRSLGTGVERAAVGFTVGALSGVGHLLGDVITPMGVRPFAPLSQTVYSLSLVQSRNPSANMLLLSAGVLAYLVSVQLARDAPRPRREPTVEVRGSDVEPE